jgi:hypothetical protein
MITINADINAKALNFIFENFETSEIYLGRNKKYSVGAVIPNKLRKKMFDKFFCILNSTCDAVSSALEPSTLYEYSIIFQSYLLPGTNSIELVGQFCKESTIS